MSLSEIQRALLPAAVGTSAIIGSSIQGMMINGKVRYSNKTFSHPYKPWIEDHNDKEGKHYRGFKACQNCVEWTVYAVPSLWLFTLYSPALSIIPKLGPVVAPWLPLIGGCASLVYSHFNMKYVEGYMESTEGRLKPFKYRTMMLKLLLYGSFLGISASRLENSGLLK